MLADKPATDRRLRQKKLVKPRLAPNSLKTELRTWAWIDGLQWGVDP
jgi:hypothetical protein